MTTKLVLQPEALKRIIHALEDKYDYLIIDTPPMMSTIVSIVLSVSNASPPPATNWSCGVVINMPLCHRGDRGFESRQDRHYWLLSSVGRATD